MDWFKHKTCSHEDPDISDSWDTFGDAGPVVFWTILEVFGKEFSHLKDEWLTLSLPYFERKLRRKWKKIEKILEFFEKRERIYFKKTISDVSITIPKFIAISSNWTVRPKHSPTESPTEITTESPTAKEEEEEKKKKKRIKNIYGTQFQKVKLTEEEYQKLLKTFGQDKTQDMIDNMDIYLESKGDKYKSHYATLLSWERKNKGGNNAGYKTGNTGHSQQTRSKSAGFGDGNPYPVDLEVTD